MPAPARPRAARRAPWDALACKAARGSAATPGRGSSPVQEECMALRRLITATSCLVALLFAIPDLQAQTTTGGLLGVVRDANGGAVPGAAVKAANAGTNAEFTAVTGDAGQYALRGLPVGTYVLTVELQG